MQKLKVGKEYEVYHTRKGKFRVRVEQVNDNVVVCVITHGKARYLTEDDRGPGSKIKLFTDRSMARFYSPKT